ncbi:MAG: BrnA antitoxin family protein [Paraburkholderia tropica]|uniref:BrnA antitoxin family protein n=1 Tax=Paraburkholderia tropica TaxID=92647 RepID=UPI0017CCAE90|nr:BrnA antitoxin family protein [Paraburkholderia tropica]MBB2984578.1 uncharacterized protein (DUF4415 family) [Paraburkholderia tropica]
MTGSKITSMTSEQMRAARSRGESRTDWERVRREANQEPGAADENRAIGETIARRRGRPVVGEPKAAISLRLPVSVLDRWKATGPGWQTRMAEVLSKTAT